MKKVLLVGYVLTCVIASSTVASSQLRFAVGPKFGMNFGTISLDPDAPNKSGKTGIMFGAAVELLFSRMFGVQIEPGYMATGVTLNQVQGAVQTNQGLVGVVVDISRSIKEISIPILFKAKFLDGPVKPYGIVGPNIGIVASANESYKLLQTNPANIQLQLDDTDISKSVSSLDFAIQFGGGVQFNIARNIGLTFDVRYALGLSNLDNSQQAQQGQAQQAAQGPSAKSRGLQLQFGALFEI